MPAAPLILWFRRDLRLTDNPALAAAVASGRPIVPIYILDETPGAPLIGGASRWWLHHSLAALARDLAARGATLVLRRGLAAAVLDELIATTGAGAVYWNRCYDPEAVSCDTALKAALAARGLEARSFNAALLFEPQAIATTAGEPYRVFTQFWKTCLHAPEPAAPVAAPSRLEPRRGAMTSDSLETWRLLPRAPDWSVGLRTAWTPGEDSALRRLDAFLDQALGVYATARDLPDRQGTSRLSPHLHFGEIGPRQVWHAARIRAGSGAGVDRFLAELGWREFSHHQLFHFPHLATRSLRPEFERFPWARDEHLLRAWQRGRTGYPIVDAGMRELWQTGWMHNRVRMIVASFLVKDLLQPWTDGAAWFWDTLVDADLANNAAGWQWVAGCGADAAPYFRVFNPVLQGEKFDPAGDYVRRFVPELGRLPPAWIHKPFQAPPDVLAAAGIVIGESYPRPLVDHGAARARALAAFAGLRRAS